MASNDGAGGSGSNLPRGLLGRNRGKAPRLPSIRAPRDLTLGGSAKKTFVPNIPARPRDKSREDSRGRGRQDNARGGKGQERGGARGRGERGRGRGRGRGDFIQTQSIFEQGAADRMRPRNHEPVERVVMGSGPSKTTIKKEKKSDKETKRILDDLLRDDFVSGPISSDPAMAPVQLPLCLDEASLALKSEGKVGNAVKIKQEKPENGESEESKEASPDVEMSATAEAAGLAVKTTTTKKLYASHISDLFSQTDSSEFGDLVLIQLPDTLPGEPPDTEDHHAQRKQHGSRQQQAEAAAPPPENNESQEDLSVKFGSCKLKDFSEGFIGKLRLHESGRTTLVLGNVALDVSMGTPTGFLQEVVSCRKSEGGKTGDISVLGHVNNKLVCIPDFDTMLENS